jgi:integrase
MKTLSRTALDTLPEGVHRIDRGLYLKRVDYPVDKSENRLARSTTRTILFRWQVAGKPRVISLGLYTPDAYADILAKGVELRKVVAEGRDPSIVRELPPMADTFEQAAETFYERMATRFSSSEHLANCLASMRAVYSVLGDLHVLKIEPGHVVKALLPMWSRAPVTARRTRMRIEKVLDHAYARLDPMRANPAAWRIVRHLLPEQPRHRPQQHATLPYRKLPEFFAALPSPETTPAAMALKFLVLTVTRTSEMLGARWSEIDFDDKLWTVPAERMKARKAHRVPLSKPALDLLKALRKFRRNDFVFPGSHKDRSLNDDAMHGLMRRLEVPATVHGMRSCFRDWAREQTTFRWEWIEQSLAHELGNVVERSYGTSDLLHLRVAVMEKWADFVTGAKRRK